jgi:hypothetical protein
MRIILHRMLLYPVPALPRLLIKIKKKKKKKKKKQKGRGLGGEAMQQQLY